MRYIGCGTGLFGRLGAALLVWFISMPFAPSLEAQTKLEGADIFKTKCAVCHGANGDANNAIGKSMKLRDLRSKDVQKQTDAELTAITHCGKGKMPSYDGKLTDAQISQLVTFMRSLAVNTTP